jgi:hypothetical protein
MLRYSPRESRAEGARRGVTLGAPLAKKGEHLAKSWRDSGAIPRQAGPVVSKASLCKPDSI